jgi:hypothetical protein
MTGKNRDSALNSVELNDWIKPGDCITRATLVEGRHTAPHVGSGWHERVVVDSERFINRFEAKADRLI